MRDRTLGYLCLSVPLLLLLVVGGLFYNKKQVCDEYRTIQFRNVSELNFINKQDPVLIRGLEVGYVKAIDVKDNSVFLSIHIKRPLEIFEDYTATVGAQGVMGARVLNIDPGIKIHSPVPVEKILTGTLLPSPPEAVAQMGQLVKAVRELNTISYKLLNGTHSEPSLILSYKTILSELNTSVSELTNRSTVLAINFPRFLDTLSYFAVQGLELNNTLKKPVPSFVDAVDSIIDASTKFTIQLNALLADSEGAMSKYKERDTLAFQNVFRNIRAHLCSLQIILKEIRNDGLSLPVRFW